MRRDNKHIADLSRHPVLTGHYTIPTAPILSLMDAIKIWVDNRYPGGLVTGLQRHGKSAAISYIRYNLSMHIGRDLSVFSLECKKHQHPSENRFYEDMLIQLGHKAASSGTPSKKLARLVEYIIEKAKVVDGALIIILDECQKMDLSYFEYLADLHNELVRFRYLPLFVLVGQPELVNMRSSLRVAKKFQIIGRFMLYDHYFHGLSDLETVAAALHAYDNQIEWPEGSHCSYSRFFFPDAFSAGWRLESEAKFIQEAFSKCREEIPLSITEDIPMQYFCTAVENFFRHYHMNDARDFHGTANIWKSLVADSGYLAAGVEMIERT